jgi:hypothetical protein
LLEDSVAPNFSSAKELLQPKFRSNCYHIMASKRTQSTFSLNEKSAKFSSNSITPHVRGAEAALILEALRTGKGIRGPNTDKLIEEILEMRRKRAEKSNVKGKKSVR